MSEKILKDVAPRINGYNYIRPLGEGGFADVYLFKQNTPNRNVAIKALKSVIATPEIEKTFLSEGNIIAKLTSHPNIISLYDVSISTDGRPYIAMEVCGDSLMSRVSKNGPLPLFEILTTGIKMCDALNMAHAHGLLHRDVKPSNLLYNEIGNLVLSDFGISIGIDYVELFRGFSKPWAAPEVLANRTNGTIASDIFGVGITLFFVTNGFNPKIDKGRKRQDIPRELEKTIDICMNPDPLKRPKSVADIAHQLQRIQEGMGFPITEFHEIHTPVAIIRSAELNYLSPNEASSTSRYQVPQKNKRQYRNTLTKSSTSEILKKRVEEKRWQLILAVVAGLSVAIAILIGIILTK